MGVVKIKQILFIFTVVASGTCALQHLQGNHRLPLLKISENNRYLADISGQPFFWLGDTGWLLFTKLNREEVDTYLSDRKEKGFNVIQAMVLHSLSAVNVYGDSALIEEDVSKPAITRGNSFEDPIAYDYWDHVSFVIDKAAEKGIYMALVPVWGNNVKAGNVTKEDAVNYAAFLAARYSNKSNIIWLVGGDIKGSDSTAIWNSIGYTLHQNDTNHLISFHPYGRTSSSLWFHNETWLDFNMFQSGHRRYDQDDTEWCFGEDNWRYVNHDYSLDPEKPTIDGEPSYEGIPQGLHDTTQPYWTDSDIRRYAYWSVFSGAFGFTYGANSVMQFYKPGDRHPAFGAREYWTEGIDLPGAGQLQYLKKLMLSRPYFERVPDQSIIYGNQGDKYNYLVATRGNDYAFIYTYTGINITLQMGRISGERAKASWFKPSDGTIIEIGERPNSGRLEFNPPGKPAEGNDWVLILDSL